MEEEVKVAVLETRLQNFETLVSRLDSAIEKIVWSNKYCRTDIGKKGLSYF